MTKEIIKLKEDIETKKGQGELKSKKNKFIGVFPYECKTYILYKI